MNAYEQAAAALLRESGCTVRKTRTSSTGRALTSSAEWYIDVPNPRGPVSFGVFAHEVGHHLKHRNGRRPRWVEEVEAEQYALDCFDRFELPGRVRYEQNVVAHLAYAFSKAVRRSPRLADRIEATYPEWWRRSFASWGASMRLAAALGYTVELVDYCETADSPGILGSRAGVCIPSVRRILIRNVLGPADRLTVLRHELEHARGAGREIDEGKPLLEFERQQLDAETA